MTEIDNSTNAQLECPLLTWLAEAVTREASDLHVSASYAPHVRVQGDLVALPLAQVTHEQLAEYLRRILPDDAWERLTVGKNIDRSLELPLSIGNHRFRVNGFYGDQGIGACFRLIPDVIPDLDWAGFPSIIADKLSGFRDGLVLVSGVTGSGKSTTLAILLERMNRRGGKRILTLEEPIEYRFAPCEHSIVTQREVGRDVDTFADGLKFGLRQDPDVILVGEIRDQDTARLTIAAAETGHLVFATLHTRDAKGAISRLADFFPKQSQDAVLSQLAMSLRAVVSQQLVPSSNIESKRELAIEVLYNTNPVASAMRQRRIESIDNAIVTGRNDGMMSMDESLRRLVESGRILRKIARRFANEPTHFE
jgi:twitching motility protein PilT